MMIKDINSLGLNPHMMMIIENTNKAYINLRKAGVREFAEEDFYKYIIRQVNESLTDDNPEFIGLTKREVFLLILGMAMADIRYKLDCME